MKQISFCGTCDWGTDHEVYGAVDSDGPVLLGYLECWVCCDCRTESWYRYDIHEPDKAIEIQPTLYDRKIVGYPF